MLKRGRDRETERQKEMHTSDICAYETERQRDREKERNK
jgi:hypothetical protein